MNIVICCSMSAVKKLIEIEKIFKEYGHKVVIPSNIEKHLAKEFSAQESTEEKLKDDLIKKYFEKIKESDAVLIVNEEKNGIASYIGGNTFLEMGFAHVLNKKNYVLNDIPNVSYRDEIIAMKPIVLGGSLDVFKP